MKEYKINTNNFITPYTIHNEINRIHLEHLYTTKNAMLSLFDLKSKLFTPGLKTLVLLIFSYGYTTRNHLYMKV